MIMNSNVAEVFTSGVTGTEQFKFSNSPIIFKILSDSLYSDKITSIVRELSSNARDAHIAAGKNDIPFEIHIPVSTNLFSSADSNIFSVKDYGTGLSEEEIYNLYTVYGESNKRSSNDFIGGFGIGSKSPFAYTETFNIISRYNGVKTTYSAFINSDGFPSITKVFSVETDEENGLEISFQTKREDSQAFVNAVRNELAFFNPFPKLNISCDIQKKNKIVEGDGWFITEDKSHGWYYGGGRIVALIGNIPYEISKKEIDCVFTKGNSTTYINFPVGVLDLSASRESIAYTERSKKTIESHLKKVKEGIVNSILEEIKDKTLYDKMCYVNSLPIEFRHYGGVSNIDEVKEYNDCIFYSLEDVNKNIIEKGCSLRGWNNSKWKKNNFVTRNTLTPSKNVKFVYVPKKITLESLAKYFKKNDIEYAYVIRYVNKDDIANINAMFGNPPYITDPKVEVVKKERSDNSYVSYRMFYIEYNSPYNLVSNSESNKDISSVVKEYAKNCRFVLLTKGYDFIGGETWTSEERNNFYSALIRFHNRATKSIRSKFGRIMFLSESSYKRMKKEGLEIPSYKECMENLSSFIKENLEFSEYEEEAKKFSYAVEKVVYNIVSDFSEEECARYASKNILFKYIHKLYNIIANNEKTKLFSDYARSVLDTKAKNEYDEYIHNEPILNLLSNRIFYDREIKECVVRYLNLEN